jgi:hypothetical protein
MARKKCRKCGTRVNSPVVAERRIFTIFIDSSFHGSLVVGLPVRGLCGARLGVVEEIGMGKASCFLVWVS